jgi:hypothetical protein
MSIYTMVGNDRARIDGVWDAMKDHVKSVPRIRRSAQTYIPMVGTRYEYFARSELSWIESLVRIDLQA